MAHLTRVIRQRPGGAIFTWSDQVPDEALDVLVATVMQQTVGQESPADRLHVRLLQGTLEAAVSEDVTPPTPTKETHGKTNCQ